MTKTTPSYLRIHHGPGHCQQPDQVSTPDATQEFWQAFSEATGWRIQGNHSPEQQNRLLLPSVDFDPMAGADQLESIPAVTRSSATRLAVAADSLTQELNDARERCGDRKPSWRCAPF